MMVFAGILIGGILIDGIAQVKNAEILTEGQTFIITILVGVLAVQKFSKSAWLKRNEEREFNNFKSRLEKRRKSLEDNGAEFFIAKNKRDCTKIVYGSAFALITCLSVMGFPKGVDPIETWIVAGVVGLLGTVVFCKSKYFMIVLSAMNKQYEENLRSGYVYNTFE